MPSLSRNWLAGMEGQHAGGQTAEHSLLAFMRLPISAYVDSLPSSQPQRSARTSCSSRLSLQANVKGTQAPHVRTAGGANKGDSAAQAPCTAGASAERVASAPGNGRCQRLRGAQLCRCCILGAARLPLQFVRGHLVLCSNPGSCVGGAQRGAVWGQQLCKGAAGCWPCAWQAMGRPAQIPVAAARRGVILQLTSAIQALPDFFAAPSTAIVQPMAQRHNQSLLGVQPVAAGAATQASAWWAACRRHGGVLNGSEPCSLHGSLYSLCQPAAELLAQHALALLLGEGALLLLQRIVHLQEGRGSQNSLLCLARVMQAHWLSPCQAAKRASRAWPECHTHHVILFCRLGTPPLLLLGTHGPQQVEMCLQADDTRGCCCHARKL